MSSPIMATPTMPATRLLSMGTLACATACAATCVINFVQQIPQQMHNFSIAFWVSSVDVLLLCALLGLGAVTRHAQIEQLFGFLQFSAGAGFLLMFIGSLVLGMAGTVGIVSGAVSMSWGLVSMFLHCATGESSAPRNEPLLPSAPSEA